MICVISGLVLTVTEITVNTHTVLITSSNSHLSLVFPPLFSCSLRVIHSILSCFLVSCPSCVQSLPSTQSRMCKQQADCFLFCLSNLHSPLSCCIIYVCHYSSFEPQRHMLSQILFIFPCDFAFSWREQEAWLDRYWYTVAALRRLKRLHS